MNWTIDETCKLIKIFRGKPPLWDSSNSYYRHRQKKNEMWEEIATEMGIDRSNVEKKMRILIGQFQRENKKVKKSKTDSKWFAYKLLLFTEEKHIQRRNREEERDSIEDELNSQESQSVKLEYESDEKTIVDENVQPSTITYSAPLSPQPIKLPNPPKLRILKRTANPIPKDTYAVMKRLSSFAKEKDEFDTFGEHVACQVRQLNSKLDRATAKHRINNILFEMEIAQCHRLEDPPLLSIRRSTQGGNRNPTSTSGASEFEYVYDDTMDNSDD